MTQQQTVLITGAGSGLGRALARRYARASFAVACADIRLERAQETVTLLEGAGHLALPVDIASDASFEQLRDELARHWEALDVLVNNAGVSSGGGLLEAPMEEWHWMLNLNLLGIVRGCRTFAPGMVARRAGRIVNIASFAGLAAAPNIMTYGVAKAGVVTMSEQLRAELHSNGVGVSVVCPAFFKTNLLESWEGGAKMRRVAEKLMETATVTADDIANEVFESSQRGRFLIVPTRTERMRWRLKRWFPETYFRKLLEMSRSRAALAKD